MRHLKHKKTAFKKRVNILLSVLLAVCLLFAGTVLGKFIVDRVLDGSFNLSIFGTPKGKILVPGAEWTDTDE